jgi:hypothetical protein
VEKEQLAAFVSSGSGDAARGGEAYGRVVRFVRESAADVTHDVR